MVGRWVAVARPEEAPQMGRICKMRTDLFTGFAEGVLQYWEAYVRHCVVYSGEKEEEWFNLNDEKERESNKLKITILQQFVEQERARKKQRDSSAESVACAVEETQNSGDSGDLETQSEGCVGDVNMGERAKVVSPDKVNGKQPQRNQRKDRKSLYIPADEEFLESMAVYLRKHGNCSWELMGRTMGVVEDLVKGKGIKYKGWNGKTFKQGVRVNITWDFEVGEDKSHGYKLTGPISKLKQYQDYLRKQD